MQNLDWIEKARQYSTSNTGLNVDARKIGDYQTKLLEWYRENRRKLPWRGDFDETPSPYGTWISEIMLQQTRVETVIAYWTKWMKVFPDVYALATATPDEVNKEWAGLGYYRRAQQLLNGAKKVAQEYDGVVPDSVVELLKVPGIGPYTAGAVASIAYNKHEPLVDGNVIRVFSRLFAIKSEVGGGAMEKQCWSIAKQLVEKCPSPGEHNQALMELGATVCKPTSPACESCPLKHSCYAYNLVNQASCEDIEDCVRAQLPKCVTEFPRKIPKKAPKNFVFLLCVLRRRRVQAPCKAENSEAIDENAFEYLFVRRPATGLLASQWEFPNIDITSDIMNSREGGEEEELEDEVEDEGTDKKEPASVLLNPLKEISEAMHCKVHDMLLDKGITLSSTPQSEKTPVNKLNEPPIVHIFSHQKHFMHVWVRDVTGEKVTISRGDVNNENNAEPAVLKVQWCSAVEMVTDVGITTGCKKVLQETERGTSTSAKRPRKAPAAVGEGQKRTKKSLLDSDTPKDTKDDSNSGAAPNPPSLFAAYGLDQEADGTIGSTGQTNAFSLMRKAAAVKKTVGSGKKSKQ